MDDHMSEREVGDVDALCGELDGIRYSLFCMKDAGYTMKIMATYGSLQPMGESWKERAGVVEPFKYSTEVLFHNHFNYRHAVDDLNSLRHSNISLEETWTTTHRWENRVFAFFLAITEVNAFNACRTFVWPATTTRAPTMLQFRKQLAEALIYNSKLPKNYDHDSQQRCQRALEMGHSHETAPKKAPRFVAGQWQCTASQNYQKYMCRAKDECKQKTRT
jgi:hypothetical protein